jgi:hypothetical protein
MPGFRPRPEWVREMKRYGILPADFRDSDPLDTYAVERRYWESLWPKPPADLAGQKADAASHPSPALPSR